MSSVVERFYDAQREIKHNLGTLQPTVWMAQYRLGELVECPTVFEVVDENTIRVFFAYNGWCEVVVWV